MADLKMWSNETEFVIAASAERASELTREALGVRGDDPDPDSYAPEAFSEMDPKQEFTFDPFTKAPETKLVKEWIAQQGEGWFATTEF
jgi:hypothetical protein